MSANHFIFWGLRPPNPALGLRPWIPLGTSAPNSLGYSPPMKIPGAANADMTAVSLIRGV